MTDKVSAEATQYRSLVFNGSIPLAINVLPHELQQRVLDPSLLTAFLQVPRMHYLSMSLDQAMKQMFGPVLDENDWPNRLDCWFEYRGIPLRWHWPIGLLFDYHVLGRNPDRPPTKLSELLTDPEDLTQSAFMQQKETQLPWHITLRLKDPPVESLYMDNSEAKCRESFVNYLKQADFVRWGGARRLTNLRKEQQDNLWEGVLECDFDKYWTVANRLVPAPPSSSPASSRGPSPVTAAALSPDGRNADTPRTVPLRLYLPGHPSPLQDIISLTNEDGSSTSLGQAAAKIVPLFFPAENQPLVRAIIQGVLVPWDTDLSWLGSCFIGVDGWIHCVVAIGTV